MKNKEELYQLIKGKRVLYIATKNADYIRVTQEINMLQQFSSSYHIIAYDDKSYLKRILKVFKELLCTSLKKYDIVFVGFMAQMIFLAFNWKLKNNVVITDFFISIYDTLVFDRKKVKEKSILGRILKLIDKKTVRSSDYLISDTREHGKYFIDEFSADENKIYVYYLEADKSIYYPMNVDKLEEYKDKYVVLYFGSILPVQGVEIVMECIKHLSDRKDIHFIIIGPIGKKVKKVNSDTVTYIDWLEQEKLAQYIAAADLCLGGHFSNTVNKAKRTIPGKVYIFQNMKKNMILGDSPANRELFSDIEYEEWFVPLGDSQGLSEKIVQFCDKV